MPSYADGTLLDKVRTIIDDKGIPKKEYRTERYIYILPNSHFYNSLYVKGNIELIEQIPISQNNIIDRDGALLKYIAPFAVSYCLRENNELKCWTDHPNYDGINGNETPFPDNKPEQEEGQKT